MAQLPVLNNRPAARGGVSGTGGAIGDAERAKIAAGLGEALGDGGEVRFGVHDRLLYSTDASLYQVEPIGVVVPRGIDAVARAVAWCSEHRVAMLPRGGGTSLAGQCTNRAVVIDLSAYCKGIGEVDVAARTVEVEAGVTIEDLNERLVQQCAAEPAAERRGTQGLFFAPDPATLRQCAIGGAIGNNAAGARSIMYGRTSENVERVEVVLAGGERLWIGADAGRENKTARRLGEGVLEIARANAKLIRERFPRTIRRNAGYALDSILDQAEKGATGETVNLVPLLCGSEGTLAVTLRAVLKLHPVSRAKGLALIPFAGVDEAIEAVRAILATGPSAVELLDDVVLEAARGNEQCREYLRIMPRVDGREADAILYVEYFGFDGGMEEVRGKFAALASALKAHGLEARATEVTDAASMNKAWALRRAGEPLLHGLPGNRKPITFVEDNAVPVERLGEFVREFRKNVERHGTRAAFWAHASVGVLHVRPLIDIHDPADRDRLRAIAVEVADLARACGGIMSGEHGDGRVRGPLLERFFGPELMRAFREVKRLFDPLNLLNPGNIVDPGPVESITANLRVDKEEGIEAPRHQGIESGELFFDYSDQGGFLHAIEQCNGAGVCRKRGGVMCPSYQATLDERHATRGRGNALRLAITGQFDGVTNWSDEETIRTLDLCLSCKGCKSECPSNVDIARLKAEYTAQRYRSQGTPLSATLTGRVRTLNKLGSLVPGLANSVAGSGVGRTVVNRLMGMHPGRSLPRFSKSLYRIAPRALPDGRAASVVLFTDCFTTYNESNVGLAAIRVLERLGYGVRLSGSHCCGRSMISVGMLPEAIKSIDRALESLRPAIKDEQVRGIVVCEPSCLSAMKDDWLLLNCRTPLALRKKLAAKAYLPEEFVDRFWDTHPAPIKSEIRNPQSEILLHAHCHQKALWGAESSARLLRRLAGDKLKVLDTGCCGMAGSFGFAREKFDLSMKIGELSLLPAVRNAPSATVVATGTSCRHQLHDAATRSALHPIELAARLLDA